ncbi:MAG TPA: hypothetical protein PK569_18030 [Thermoanaerobaculia bacterium]|jgi:hypothetical protein|nr:hypothetical protein [Thermoanaerobaculia bacterium]HQN09466.1 hypothetical protein [Thermoanaerobaculia bacterium]
MRVRRAGPPLLGALASLLLGASSAPGSPPATAGRPTIEVLHKALVPYPPVRGEPLVAIVAFIVKPADGGTTAVPVDLTLSIEQEGRVLARSRPHRFEARPFEPSEARRSFTPAAPGDYTVRLRLECLGGATEALLPLRVTAAEAAATARRIDCSHLRGSAARIDPATGEPSCVCDPGTMRNAAGTECVTCADVFRSFREATQRDDFAEAERILSDTPACAWPSSARDALEAQRLLYQERACAGIELEIMAALNADDLDRTSTLLSDATGRGCAVGPAFLASFQRRLDQKKATARAAADDARDRRRSAVSVETWRRLSNLAAWAQSVGPRGMSAPPPGGQTAPGAVPYAPPSPRNASVPSSGTTSGHGSAQGSGASEVECRRRFCPMCETNVNLLGVSVSEDCTRCLASKKTAIADCTRGGPGRGGSGSGGASAPGGRAAGAPAAGEACYVGASWGEPPRYAVACDSGDGPGPWKLAGSGYNVLVLGPVSWKECAAFMRARRVPGW